MTLQGYVIDELRTIVAKMNDNNITFIAVIEDLKDNLDSVEERVTYIESVLMGRGEK